MKNFTRRRFVQTLSATGAVALTTSALPRIAFAQTPAASPLRFPANFLWGCATASYQVEGAVKEDGRGQTNWDVFSHTPGKTFHGETGDVADDSYHRYKEDIKLLKNLGVTGYRFSISWSRIFPNGTGQPNEKGLAYYQRVVDELLKNNIEPYITSVPLGSAAGFARRLAIARHIKSVRRLCRLHLEATFGSRPHFFTTNEFVCFTDLGYKTGQFAPGLKLPAAQVNQIRHHGILAHGMGVQAIRANAKSGTQVGLAENANVYVPVIESREHIEAAQRATREGMPSFSRRSWKASTRTAIWSAKVRTLPRSSLAT